MVSPGAFPETEAALLRDVPESNRPNVLPRELLLRGERVYFETRPGLLARYWGRLTLVVVVEAFLVFALVIPGDSDPGGVGFFVALVGLIILLILLAWRGTSYALTDRRVLAVSGIMHGGLEQASYEEIQSFSSTPGSTADLIFDARAVAPSGLRPVRRSRGARIVWRSVEKAPSVYAFVQETFGFKAAQLRDASAKAQLLTTTLADKIRCEYCGNAVAPVPGRTGNVICPSCGAPLLRKKAPP